MSDKPRKSEDAPEKPSVTLPGKVEKIIPGPIPAIPDKAQIPVEGADDLYKEIRVENTLQDENGKPVALKKGADVEVTITLKNMRPNPKIRPTQNRLPISILRSEVFSSPINEVSALIRRGFSTVRALKFATTRREIRLRREKEIHHCGVNDRVLERQSAVSAFQSPACHLTPLMAL